MAHGSGRISGIIERFDDDMVDGGNGHDSRAEFGLLGSSFHQDGEKFHRKDEVTENHCSDLEVVSICGEHLEGRIEEAPGEKIRIE